MESSHLTEFDLLNYDVVITTYPVIEMQYRKIVDKNRVSCNFCGRRFLPRTLVNHQRFFCGQYSKRSAKLQKRERKEGDGEGEGVRGRGRRVSEKEARDNLSREMAVQKAMVTLKIKSKVPTPTTIYREMMAEANRVPLKMFEKGTTYNEPVEQSGEGREEGNDDDDVEGSMDVEEIDTEENLKMPPDRQRKTQSSTKIGQGRGRGERGQVRIKKEMNLAGDTEVDMLIVKKEKQEEDCDSDTPAPPPIPIKIKIERDDDDDDGPGLVLTESSDNMAVLSEKVKVGDAMDGKCHVCGSDEDEVCAMCNVQRECIDIGHRFTLFQCKFFLNAHILFLGHLASM